MSGHFAHRLARVAVSSCALAVLVFGVGAAEPGPPDLEAAGRNSRASLVIVESFLYSPLGPGKAVPATNTGFFVSTDGHVLTSLLAVSGSSWVQVRSLDGRHSPARLRAFDQSSGLALLMTELKDTPVLEFGPDSAQPGQWVLAVAATRSPDGEIRVSTSQGKLSSREASVKLCGFRWEGLLEGALGVSWGCAASPILDEEGRLLGVVLGIESRADGSVCSYALPAAALKPILSELLQGRTRRVGWLGVALARSRGMEGLTVHGVLEGSPAYAAGLRPGDVLLQIDGQTISRPPVFESKIAQAAPGDEIELGLLRGDEMKTIAVGLGARPLLISRIPERMPYDVRRLRPRAFPAMSDMRTQLIYKRMMEDLRRQNRNLSERVLQLEQRIALIEQGQDAADD